MTYLLFYIGDGSLTGNVEPGFLCSNGTILDLVQLCNGKANCESGEDEAHTLCASKLFKCITIYITSVASCAVLSLSPCYAFA